MKAFLLGLVILFGAPSKNSKTDRLGTGDLPVEMTSKGSLKIDLEKRIGHAENDVVIRRADIIVCCDRATAKYAKDRIESVECMGRVVIVRPDGTVAQANRAVFKADQDRVKLSGLAKVRSEDTLLEGDEIVYDIGKDKLEVRGANSRFRFVPKDLPEMKLERKCPP